MGVLDEHIVGTGIVVTPFVYFQLQQATTIKIAEREVRAAFWVPLAFFFEQTADTKLSYVDYPLHDNQRLASVLYLYCKNRVCFTT